MRQLPKGKALMRLATSVAEDDGPGKETGEPEPVPTEVDKEYRRVASSLDIYYQPLAQLGIGITVPYFDVELHDNYTNQDGENSGFGDVRIYALWAPWEIAEDHEPHPFWSLHNVAFIVGVSIPTADDEPAEDPLARDGQLGGGSWDIRLGANYWGDLNENLCLFTGFNVQIDTGYDGGGYRNAPAYSWRIGGGWFPLEWLQLYLTFRINYQDRNYSKEEEGGRDDASGATLWYVAPGVVVKPLEWMLIDTWVSIPVYHRVNAEQVLPGITWTFGITVTF